MKPILELRDIGKRYRISHETDSYLTFRDRLTGILKSRQGSRENFWALKNVSLDIKQGQSLGIVGRNGAGKSTLLKILSRITPPTVGKFIARGRIASLLEVGTGFHPELTGRENVFLNGSLLGMKRSEISRKFDEIVDFSGVEKFLDTPLKHYSSGMQLRLAFAVAAFLEPEILVIDEVLAVGDAEFQQKCMGKMEDVHNNGRTILFVSHNLEAVESLCQQSIWIHDGQLHAMGDSRDIIRDYLSTAEGFTFERRELTTNVTLEKLSFAETSISPGQSLHFSIQIGKIGDLKLTDLALLFYNYRKQRVAIHDLRPFFPSFFKDVDLLSYEGRIERVSLVEGDYYVGLYFGGNSTHADFFDLAKIQVRQEYKINGIRPYDIQHRGFVELK